MRLTRVCAGVAVCCALALSLGGGPAHAELPWVKADGNQFVLPSGQQIIFRGFDTLTGPAASYYWYSLHDYQRMAALGANYQSIRVTIGALGYQSFSASYLNQLEAMVNYAAQAGIYTDFKITDFDLHPVFDWTAFWQDADGQQQRWIDSIDRLAEAFAGNPAVLGYDVLNEPHQGTLGKSASAFAADYLNPFYLKAIASVRQIDPQHIIFFQPENEEGVGDVPYTVPLQASNISFVAHFYPAHPAFSTADFLPLIQRYESEANASNAPLIIGEFGSPWNIAQDGDTPLESQYEALETVTYAMFARYGVSYSRPWWADEKSTTPGPDGEVYTWAMVLGTKSLNGPLRWWAADPFEQAAAAGPP
jgi:hypothetical protein